MIYWRMGVDWDFGEFVFCFQEEDLFAGSMNGVGRVHRPSMSKGQPSRQIIADGPRLSLKHTRARASSGLYTRDVHRFPPGRGKRVLAGEAVVIRRAPLSIDHALATESVQSLVQSGVFAAPRAHRLRIKSAALPRTPPSNSS